MLGLGNGEVVPASADGGVFGVWCWVGWIGSLIGGHMYTYIPTSSSFLIDYLRVRLQLDGNAAGK
jgi:hypothetical protein